MRLTRGVETYAFRTLAFAAIAVRQGAAGAVAAWPVLVGRVVFYLLILTVLSALWDQVAAERITALASTLPPGGLSAYIAVTEWVTLSAVMVHNRVEDDIRRGGLDTYVLRPKSYLLQRLAPAFGETAVRLGVLGAAGLGFIALKAQMPPAQAWPGILVLGILACVIHILLYALVGLAAFWIRRVLPATLVVQKLSFLLGGLLAPISLYPDPLFGIAAATPFAANLYWVAVQVVAPSASSFWTGIALQILWIGILSVLCAAVLRVGLRKALREGF